MNDMMKRQISTSLRHGASNSPLFIGTEFNIPLPPSPTPPPEDQPDHGPRNLNELFATPDFEELANHMPTTLQEYQNNLSKTLRLTQAFGITKFPGGFDNPIQQSGPDQQPATGIYHLTDKPQSQPRHTAAEKGKGRADREPTEAGPSRPTGPYRGPLNPLQRPPRDRDNDTVSDDLDSMSNPSFPSDSSSSDTSGSDNRNRGRSPRSPRNRRNRSHRPRGSDPPTPPAPDFGDNMELPFNKEFKDTAIGRFEPYADWNDLDSLEEVRQDHHLERPRRLH